MGVIVMSSAVGTVVNVSATGKQVTVSTAATTGTTAFTATRHVWGIALTATERMDYASKMKCNQVVFKRNSILKTVHVM